jgi:AbrB family looped-hinge helix DNA binding protein
MLMELRKKSQVTIPKALIDKLGLNEGDKLEIFEKDGAICMVPVVTYSKKYLDEIRDEINAVKTKIASGEQPVFANVDTLFARLEEG